jgi:sulfotransferase family protein
MSTTPLRLAMWSGPRNISTAMMRAWGNRNDTFVCDEPLYAHYLEVTGKDHPGAAEVIANGQTDLGKVAAWLTGAVPEGKAIFFQKHMAHHLLPEIDRAWLVKLTNCLLIRQPRDVLLSYIKIVAEPEAADTGFPQLKDLFHWATRHQGKVPPVLDAQDVQDRPRIMLGHLCDYLGVDFQESMLAWAPGLRPTDGVWAKFWYKEVLNSTCFRPYEPRTGTLPATMKSLYEECMAAYEELYAERLR